MAAPGLIVRSRSVQRRRRSPRGDAARPDVHQMLPALCRSAPRESSSDYGAVVLQMAILDTLLRIEEKLGRLAPATLADAAD